MHVPGWVEELASKCGVCGLPLGLHSLKYFEDVFGGSGVEDFVLLSHWLTRAGVFEEGVFATVLGCAKLNPASASRAARLIEPRGMFYLGAVLAQTQDKERYAAAVALLRSDEFKLLFGLPPGGRA